MFEADLGLRHGHFFLFISVEVERLLNSHKP